MKQIRTILILALCATAGALVAPTVALAVDATPPVGTASLPTVVTSTSVNVTLDLSDPESGVVAVRFSNDGVTWGDWTPLPPTVPPTLPTRPWTLAPGLGPKTVTVEARNGAGLTAEFIATTTLALPTPSLTLKAPLARLVYGSATTLSGMFQLPGMPLTLERMRVGEPDWVVLRTFVSGLTGGFLFKPEPPATTTYRVTFAGDSEWGPASAEVVVPVRCALDFTPPAPFYQGVPVMLKGSIAPAHPGTVLTVQRKESGVWSDWKKTTLDGHSRFAVSFNPRSYGTFWFRVKMPSDGDHAKFTSSPRAVVALNPNPHHVPTYLAHYIVIVVHEYKLYYYEYGRITRVFPVALGRPGFPTPLGHFYIHSKGLNPGGAHGAAVMYYHSGGIGIHGTNEPWLLSRFPRPFSHGCARMYNSDVLWLYARSPVGTHIHNIP
jgi:hypothetical protein